MACAREACARVADASVSSLPTRPSHLWQVIFSLRTTDGPDGPTTAPIGPGGPTIDHDVEVGRGSLSLLTILREQAEPRAAPVHLTKNGEHAGTLTVSLKAVDALWRIHSSSSGAPRQDEVRIDVGALTLVERLRNDAAISELWVEVDLLRLADTSTLKTHSLQKSALECVPVPPARPSAEVT